jgi:hypothetical protein
MCSVVAFTPGQASRTPPRLFVSSFGSQSVQCSHPMGSPERVRLTAIALTVEPDINQISVVHIKFLPNLEVSSISSKHPGGPVQITDPEGGPRPPTGCPRGRVQSGLRDLAVSQAESMNEVSSEVATTLQPAEAIASTATNVADRSERAEGGPSPYSFRRPLGSCLSEATADRLCGSRVSLQLSTSYLNPISPAGLC